MALLDDGVIDPELWPTVQVFESCAWSYASAGMGASRPTDISGVEILANCHLLRIPVADRPEIHSGVRLMAAAALQVFRERQPN